MPHAEWRCPADGVTLNRLGPPETATGVCPQCRGIWISPPLWSALQYVMGRSGRTTLDLLRLAARSAGYHPVVVDQLFGTVWCLTAVS